MVYDCDGWMTAGVGWCGSVDWGWDAVDGVGAWATVSGVWV